MPWFDLIGWVPLLCGTTSSFCKIVPGIEKVYYSETIIIMELWLQGNNASAIHQLRSDDKERTGYVSFEEVELCLNNGHKLHPQLYSCYVELALVMFVAVDDNRSILHHLCYTFVSSPIKKISCSLQLWHEKIWWRKQNINLSYMCVLPRSFQSWRQNHMQTVAMKWQCH